MDSRKLEMLWKSRQTMLEVLRDRGYSTDGYPELTLQEFTEWVGDDSESSVKEAMTITIDDIIVLWSIKDKLGVNIQSIYSQMEKENIKKAIVVVDVSVTDNAKKVISSLRIKKVYIHVYTLTEAQFNIMKHRLVPKHEVCAPKEKKQVMKAYSVNASQLPGILSSDPVIRHLGAIKGQLIRITRNSETQPGNPTITYRLVV